MKIAYEYSGQMSYNLCMPPRKNVVFQRFVCDECGENYLLKDGDVQKMIRRGHETRFCDNNCKRDYFRKNKKTRKEIWTKYNRKRSTKIKKIKWHENKNFDGNATIIGKTCAMCGSKEKLVIHHSDGCNGKQGKTLNNHPDNLIVLCRSCHPKVHNRHWIKEVSIVDENRN